MATAIVQSDSFAVASKVVKTFAMTVRRIRGFKVAANDRWLQIHNTKVLPANGVVPVKSYPIYGTAPFDMQLELAPVVLSTGCTFAVSSTEGTLTISAETVDLSVTGDSAYDNTGTSTAGDYTTDLTDLLIWADTQTTTAIHRLKRIECALLADAGMDLYMKIFCHSTYGVGSIPVLEKILRQNTAGDWFFDNGLYQRVSSSPHNGCYVFFDISPGPVVGGYSGGAYAIKGTYK